jgi:hypothetical protein
MFVVEVADNFHYMDEGDTYKHGEFASWPEAVAAAQQIVDRYLVESYRPGVAAATLYDSYLTFGDDPFISPVPPGERFSAWDYAKQRCEEICASQGRENG